MTSPRSILFCALLFIPVTAHAQSEPVIQLRAAFGATDHSGVDSGAASAALLSLRAGGGALAIEPECVLSHRFQSVGLNVLRRWPGRVAPFVGGGTSYLTERRGTHPTAVSGDEPADRRGGAQAIGGADVRVSPRVAVFGQVRAELRSSGGSGGRSVVQGFGGLAIAIR